MSTKYFSTGISIFLTLFAAAMWGSWMQIIKHREDFPLSGMAFLIYLFSCILIWGITILLSPILLPQGIFTAISSNMKVIPTILLGGGMMSLGMLISLLVMGRVGLLLYTAISGALGSLLGVLTSVAEEGLPSGTNSLFTLICCTTILILASFISNYAAILRDKDKYNSASTSYKDAKNTGRSISLQALLLLILSTVLINGWSIGTAAGTARGVPPILTCAFMSLGSFLSLFFICSFYFTITKKWNVVFCKGTSKKPLLLCLIGSVCHYGGNLISIYSMPVISATLSFLFGRTANIWTIFWGIYYKEFAGVQKRTIIVLFLGLSLFIIGVLFLGLFSYR